MGKNVGNSTRWIDQRSLLTAYDELLVRHISPDLGSRLLEVGCAQGTMTQSLLGRDLVVAADCNPHYVALTQARFSGHPALVCLCLDIVDSVHQLAALQLDSVLCANVLEHISDDALALKQLASILPPGGRLVVLVPAEPRLYCDLDRSVGHFRRYTSRELVERLRGAGFTVNSVRYWNSPGVVGWILNGKVLRRKGIPDWQLRTFNFVAPLVMAIESRLRLPIGLSLVATCVKTGPQTE